MALRRMWDAAWPPTSPPRWEAAAGYIGGGTPHLWTDAEWAATGTRWRLPIFVRVPPTSHSPHDDAAKAIAWLTAHQVPAGVCMALDIETAHADDTDPKTWDPDDYIRAFDADMVAAGWKVITYGTKRTLLQTPKPSGGWWDAEWTNVPHLNAGSAATQYGGDTTLGQPYDASLVADSTSLWDMEEEPMPTLQEIEDLFTKSGSAVRQAQWEIGVRVVNAVLGTGPRSVTDVVDISDDNPARKGLAALVGGELAGLKSTLEDLVAKWEAGLPVTLTQAQVDEIKAALQRLEGSALVQLAVSPAP